MRPELSPAMDFHCQPHSKIGFTQSLLSWPDYGPFHVLVKKFQNCLKIKFKRQIRLQAVKLITKMMQLLHN